MKLSALIRVPSDYSPTTMNKILLAMLVSVSAAAALAQVFRPEVVSGAVLGGLAGAIIGNNSGHGNGGRGALIGAATGAVLGGITSEANRDQTWGNAPVRRQHAPRRGHERRDDDVFPSVILGGITGAIIGNNSGRGDGARGAVIGAIGGGILGSISHDNQRAYGPSPRFRHIRNDRQRVVYVYDDEPASVEQAAPQQAPVIIINNYYGGTGGGASGCNALFGR